MSARLDALRACLAELPRKARKLLSYRYRLALTPREIANRIEATRDAVYKALARTRMKLQDCIRRRMALAERGVR